MPAGDHDDADGFDGKNVTAVAQQENRPRYDENALRVNQAALIVFLVAGFVLNEPLVALFVALVLALGTLLRVPGFMPVYRYILKPMNIVKPRIVNDDPKPHQFAQGVGAACTLAGALLLFSGQAYLGWGLVWVVIALAGLNLFTGFCAGCFLYFWINRIRGRDAHDKSEG